MSAKTKGTRVLLVTTWETACGIAEHSALLKEAVEAADPSIVIQPFTDLHPQAVVHLDDCPPVVHLNYHAALHSQWTPERIHQLQLAGHRVLVSYHDTGVPNSTQCKEICTAADYFIVHEPCDDLPQTHGEYLRQGVPAAESDVYFSMSRRPFDHRPVVGTVGFPFPWKNLDLLCEASARVGWGVLLITPGATDEQVAAWTAVNPAILVHTDFVPRRQVVSLLSGCDATAFLYSCANTGTSAAIRQGIAARKPVLALAGCRQFRDLAGERAITWLGNGSVEGIQAALEEVPSVRLHHGMVSLAHRNSWEQVGRRYAQIYRRLQEAA